jgi:hypothetical protein
MGLYRRVYQRFNSHDFFINIGYTFFDEIFAARAWGINHSRGRNKFVYVDLNSLSAWTKGAIEKYKHQIIAGISELSTSH